MIYTTNLYHYIINTSIIYIKHQTPTVYGSSDNRINSETKQSAEAGLALYMDELQHYDTYVINSSEGYAVILKLNIGGIKHIQKAIPLPTGEHTFWWKPTI